MLATTEAAAKVVRRCLLAIAVAMARVSLDLISLCLTTSLRQLIPG